MERIVKLKVLKSSTKRALKDYPITRSIILEEADTMPAGEFILKCKVWLQLLERELNMKNSGQLP